MTEHSSSSSKTPAEHAPPAEPPKPKLSAEAQLIVDQLAVQHSVFVAELSEHDEDALRAAGYACDADELRDGFFVRKLSAAELAERDSPTT